MIPHLENLYFYSRKGNILYGVTPDAVEVPLIKFKQNFPDLLMVEKQPLEYMKKYMEMWPELWENVKEENNQQQLKLF